MAGGKDGNPDYADLFRAIHTLKGNCSLFGLERIAAACHEVESAMVEEQGVLEPERYELVAKVWEETADRQSPGDCDCGNNLLPGSHKTNQNFGRIIAEIGCATVNCSPSMSNSAEAMAFNNLCGCMEPIAGTGGSTGTPPEFPKPNPIHNGLEGRRLPTRQMDLLFGEKTSFMQVAGSSANGMTQTERDLVPIMRRDFDGSPAPGVP